MRKKSKYNRRRAIECKIVERSANNPGYCKYNITIAELDGTVHTQPAYGKDMQDALSRLMNQERSIKIEKKVMNNPFLFFLAWLAVMGWPTIFGSNHDSPWYIAYAFLGVIGLIGITAWWSSYINKGK